MNIDLTLSDVADELERAIENYPPFASAHEGYAVILEELDELWDEVKPKPSERSVERMRAEAVQVAAMSMRFVLDVCTDGADVAPDTERPIPYTLAAEYERALDVTLDEPLPGYFVFQPSDFEYPVAGAQDQLLLWGRWERIERGFDTLKLAAAALDDDYDNVQIVTWETLPQWAKDRVRSNNDALSRATK